VTLTGRRHSPSQLRGEAERRQVKRPTVALSHNIGGAPQAPRGLHRRAPVTSAEEARADDSTSAVARRREGAAAHPERSRPTDEEAAQRTKKASQ